MFDFHTKVGLRLLRPSADNPISGKVQEQIDAEVNKILTVRKFLVDLHACHPSKHDRHVVGCSRRKLFSVVKLIYLLPHSLWPEFFIMSDAHLCSFGQAVLNLACQVRYHLKQ